VQVWSPTSTYYIKEIVTKIKRRGDQAAADVVLALPGGKVKGIVTDETGAPGKGDVMVYRDGTIVADALITPDGTFEVDGLEPGGTRLQAYARSAESDITSYLVSEDSPPTARLLMRTLIDVPGQVLAEDGAPIAGAVVRYGDALKGRVRQAISGPNGEFTLRVPQQTIASLIAVVAVGFPTTVRTMRPVSSPSPPTTQRIVMGTRSASLHILHPPDTEWPYVTIDGQAALRVTSLLQLAGPEGLAGLLNDGLQVEVEPGTYTVCYGLVSERTCHSATVPAGNRETFSPERTAGK
jgi:hypothetical protein